MKYDITDKLGFEENPKIIINNVEIEVDAGATALLKVLQLSTDPEITEYEAIEGIYNNIFKESERKKIEKLKLNGDDFIKLVKVGTALCEGEDPDEALNEEGANQNAPSVV